MNKLIFSLCIMIFSLSSSAQTKYLHCGHILDCVGNKPLAERTIVVTDNKIQKIEKGYLEAHDSIEVINLKSHYVMPGIMDMHVHIEGQSSPARYSEGFRMNEADIALRATIYCERTLMAGVTTVRDMGGSGVNVSLRNAIKAGYIKGPRILTAEKALATTGGHADPTNGVRDDLKKDPGPKEGVVNSRDEAYKAVRQRYKNGADCIKITATGGVLSVAKDGMGPQFRTEIIESVVAAANDYGFVTAAHAHGAEGMKRAVLGGIHSIEHGTFMKEEVMKLMKERGTYLVPTISAGMFVYEKAKANPRYFPAVIRAKAIEIGPQIQNTFGRAYKAGVNIAFGTDTGVSPHGDNLKELQYMVEAGMPPYEAIKSGTVGSSALMRISDDYGTLESGKMADIIAVDANPLEDMTVMEDVDFVMKDGFVYKNK